MLNESEEDCLQCRSNMHSADERMSKFYITLFISILFYILLSVAQNIVMNLNNVMYRSWLNYKHMIETLTIIYYAL